MDTTASLKDVMLQNVLGGGRYSRGSDDATISSKASFSELEVFQSIDEYYMKKCREGMN